MQATTTTTTTTALAPVMARLGGTHESTQQWPTSSMCPPDTLHMHSFVTDASTDQRKHQTDQGTRWSSIG